MAGVTMTHASTTAGAGSAHGAESCSEKPSKGLPDVHQGIRHPDTALLHESSRARTMPTDRILTGRCDTTLVGRGRCPIQDLTTEDDLTPLPG